MAGWALGVLILGTLVIVPYSILGGSQAAFSGFFVVIMIVFAGVAASLSIAVFKRKRAQNRGASR